MAVFEIQTQLCTQFMEVWLAQQFHRWGSSREQWVALSLASSASAPALLSPMQRPLPQNSLLVEGLTALHCIYTNPPNTSRKTG